MKVPELYHRIGRNARGGDFTKLDMTEQTDLAAAANSAMQEVYNRLPIYFKEITEGFVLPGPRVLSNVAVTQYSNELSLAIFDVSEIGRTVVLDGDAAWNQVVGVSTLLNPYMGASGVVAGNVYGNAFYSTRYPFDRIIGDPKYADQGIYPFIRSTLVRSNQEPGIWYQQTIGRPQIWWPQAMGNSEGNNPVMVLRVSPAPDTAYSMNVRLSFWPKRLTIADYTLGTTIYVPDQFLEKSLIPIAWRALMSTPVWGSKDKDFNDRIERRALEAEAFLKEQPAQQAPRNQIYTPCGY